MPDHTTMGNPFQQGRSISPMPRPTPAPKAPTLLERARAEIERQEREAPIERERKLRSLRAKAHKAAFRALSEPTAAEDWEPVDVPQTNEEGVLLERDGVHFIYTEEGGLRMVSGNRVFPIDSFNDFVEAVKALEAIEAGELGPTGLTADVDGGAKE